MTIHVLLTADNHLDPSAVQYGPKRFERKRDFQRCFEVLVNFALENKPDILLIGGDFYDGILPGNPTRAFVAEQFKRLHEKNIKTVLVSGHHDTPRSAEQGASPLAVHARSGHIYFLDEQHPASKKINGTPVIYPGSTERVSFNEEGEKKGFVWLELDKTGIVQQEFHPTPARPVETLEFRVTGEGSLTRQIEAALEKRIGDEKILRVRVQGKVTLDQLSTYKRSALYTYAQDKFFHIEFDEEQLNVLTMVPLESLPKTTPLQELDRTFQNLLEKAGDQERPLVQEAWKLTVAK